MQRIHSTLLILFVFFSSISLVSCKKDADVLPDAPPPVVNAGNSRIVTLPVDTVYLTGSAKDSTGKVVSYLWSQVSGPAASTIDDPGSASTFVQGLVPGTYVFQLMATDDKGLTGVDTATVTVKPSPLETLTLQPNANPFEYSLSVKRSRRYRADECFYRCGCLDIKR